MLTNTLDTLFELKNLEDFGTLMIKLASPDDIRRWSRGEVTKPETINYRTLKSEKDGLFDEKIFGPTKDWECYCGKYKRIRYKGVICDKCGVEVTQSRVRRERMGHISLACPVAHIWFFKGAPSKISSILGIAPRAMEQVVYFARYMALNVDEDKKKVAIKLLETALNDNEKEIITNFKEKKDLLAVEAEKAKVKIESKIKDKEQLSLVKSEIELDERKKETALSEDEKANLSRNGRLFENLIALVRSLKTLSILSEEEYDELYTFGAADFFEAKMGAEAVLSVLSEVNLEKLSTELRKEVDETKTTSTKYIKIVKRLKLVDGIRKAKIDPTWMILKVLPVLPPDLRPMVQLSGGRFATSDLNDLYRRVINRNNRLKHLMSLGAPEIILRNEKRMLQEAVDSLLDSSQRKATRRARGRQSLRSLSDLLKGKQGRFRQNLLGKRVDYSGRSVVIVGPDLKLNQCGLPKEMALEMFKPFVLREMIARGIAPNVKSAKNMLDRRPPEVFDILEEITKDHPVILNRAPTLHKLGMQAFYPLLIEGSAIRLHPAVCSGFNADFDGDQMAVHVPLSTMAIEEAKTLMLPEHNLLRPSDGSPVSTPASKEMALGVYYLTSIDTKLTLEKTVFSDKNEAVLSHQSEKIELRQPIMVRIDGKIIETTVGRIYFNEILPPVFDFVNESCTSSVIKKLFSVAYTKCDSATVVLMIDAVKNLGFTYGTVSGISFGVFDAVLLPEKGKLIKEAEGKVSDIDVNFNQGLITLEEKKRMKQEIWLNVSEDIADKTWALMTPTNPIRVVIDAKVGRASRDQVKQLSAMRGLVVDPLGKIVELPIKSNFREGLSVFEYVTSSRGSRKGLTDTAIKTADAGYLTRRLVDVSHDLIIRLVDCETTEGLTIRKIDRPTVFTNRIVGRYLLHEVKDSKNKVIAVSGDVISEDLANKIDKAEVKEVILRSALTCGARHGLCVKCYGWDLSTKKDIEVGSPVGIVAAQSVGEPGTQLTLRTKHAAGAVGVDVTQGLPRVEELVEARAPKIVSSISAISGKCTISETEEGYRVVVTASGKIKEEREYIIPKTLELAVKDNEIIEAGTPLAIGSLDMKEILAIKGLRATQEYLVSELQKVYESQGIGINDKHFEVIARKMSDEIRVVKAGDTVFLPGELASKATFESENEKTLAAGGEPASASQTILGITRRSLYTESWLSAASFEQTTDVLTESSLMAREDKLLGLKENVIIGRLIPVTAEKAMLKN
ncbi:MAG: DNA-directed RNA polymerase subunit beta' [Patescibacteria group bacterium]